MAVGQEAWRLMPRSWLPHAGRQCADRTAVADVDADVRDATVLGPPDRSPGLGIAAADEAALAEPRVVAGGAHPAAADLAQQARLLVDAIDES